MNIFTMQLRRATVLAACLPVFAAAPALAVTSATATDPSGDVKVVTGSFAKSPMAPASVDISQATLSVDQGSKKVFLKIRAKDVSASVSKSGKKAEQSYSFSAPQAGIFVSASPGKKVFVTTNEDYYPFVPSQAQFDQCRKTTVSFDFTDNSVVFAAPLACFGKNPEKVKIDRVGSAVQYDDAVATDFTKAFSVAAN